MRRVTRVLQWMLVIIGVLSSRAAWSQEMPAPPTPARALQAEAGVVLDGEAWLTDTGGGKRGYHFHGPAAVAFELEPLQLTPGHYRIGMIARTGTRWIGAIQQVASYRLELHRGRAQVIELGGVQAIDSDAARPVRVSGQPGAWGNWFGGVQGERPVHLRGDERLVVRNLRQHGGVVALWLVPAEGLAAAWVRLSTGVANNAFLAGDEPQVQVEINWPSEMPETAGQLRVERFDLLTEETDVRHLPVQARPGEIERHVVRYAPEAGVYRVSAALVEDVSAEPTAPPARCLFACSPARPVHELPDDWPLAGHVTSEIPPLPGFRWHRYFASWAEIHKAPGVFDWSAFDAAFAQVRNAGGRMMVAWDGSPIWTTSRGKAGMSWSAPATAYPPDDWAHLREYLDAMIARYADDAGTLGALELCNEANTAERWQGTPQQLEEMAQVFRAAARASGREIAVVGIAVSAGDHSRWVQQVVDAGVLAHVDAVSAHFYEELSSLERETPINNLPKHVESVRAPMRRAGFDLPIINSESGIEFANRDRGRIVPQSALNAAAQADDAFDAERPWMIGTQWREVSERRAAAMYVSGIVALMGEGVMQTYCYTNHGFLIDEAPSLPWVAIGRLGHHLEGVNYRVIEALETEVPRSDGSHGSVRAMAYRLGSAGEKQVIVAWTLLSDTRVGRSKSWQPWLEPVPVRVRVGEVAGEMADLYGRTSQQIRAESGWMSIECGEEPVFIRIGE